MQEGTSTLELKERLALIERMIAEGRHASENWGWVFVVWGVAFYAAAAWASWKPASPAWPVTMLCGLAVTLLIGTGKRGRHPGTTIDRAIACVWIATAISMFLIFTALGFTGRMDQHSFVALLASMLAMANAASALILKWKIQLACAAVWWAVSVAACFGSAEQLWALFLTAIFFCQIIFGIYAMICHWQRRQRSGAAHA